MDQRFTRKQLLLLVAVSLGSLLTFLDLTIVNISVPTIVTELHTTLTTTQWIITAYTIGVASLLLSMGRIGDRYGQKRIFVGGLAIFTFASLACALSVNIGMLIAARSVQSVGAAALMTLSFSILVHEFPVELRGKVTAIYGGISASAAALGPSLGGVITQYASWHWIFLINVPIGLVAIVLSAMAIPERAGADGEPIDALGTALVSAGLFLLVLGLSKGNDWGWVSLATLGTIAASVALIGAFVWWELRAPVPMMDVRMFRTRKFAAASLVLMAFGFATMGAELVLILYMTGVLGFSEIKAALCITPMPVMAMLLMPFVARLTGEWGPKNTTMVGGAIFAIGLGLLAPLTPHAEWTDIIWRTAITGVGFGLIMVPAMTAGLFSLPTAQASIGSGVLNTARQVGFAIGVAVLISAITSASTTQLGQAKRDARGLVRGNNVITADARKKLLDAVATIPDQVGGEGSSDTTIATAIDESDIPTEVVSLGSSNADLSEIARQSKTYRTGVRDLDTGASSVATGAVDLSRGIRRLAGGLYDLCGGSTALASGARKLSGGATDLADGLAAGRQPAHDLAAGSNAVHAGANCLSAGLKRIDSASGTLYSASQELGSGSVSVAQGASSLSGALAKLSAGAGDVKTGADGTKQLLEAYAQAHPEAMNDATFQQALGTAGATADGAGSLNDGLGTAASSAKKLDVGAGNVAGGAKKLAAGLGQLSTGTGSAYASSRTLAGGAGQVSAGSAQLQSDLSDAQSGSQNVRDGARKLARGANTLASGAGQARAGAKALRSGARKLNDATSDVSSGTAKAAKGASDMADGFAGATALQLGHHIEDMVKDDLDKAFNPAFIVATLAALLCVLFALPLGNDAPEGDVANIVHVGRRMTATTG